MKKLFKCTVCSFIWEGEQAPDVCPKCGQPHDKYVELSQEIIDKVIRAWLQEKDLTKDKFHKIKNEIYKTYKLGLTWKSLLEIAWSN